LTHASRAAGRGLRGALDGAPMALVSSWRRGYLPGFVALVAVVGFNASTSRLIQVHIIEAFVSFH
jgi:hypothetical protein